MQRTWDINACGTDTVLLVVFGLILFGAVEYVGSLLILWPIIIDVLGEFGIKKGETPFYAGVFGVYLAATLGQPMFPFKGAALVVVSAYENLSGNTVSYPSYIAYNIIMSIILLACYLLLLKFVFLLMLLTFALITTNFANNAGMAVVLLPVVMTFADQYPSISTVVICMSITMMVFVAVLTPAASPYCGMMHAKTDAISLPEIFKLGIPMCIIAILVYTFVGVPIANILF